ncbi:2-phospho-L-lactate transferase CofD family protein [Spirillospora sp. NPDC048911]|uniref:2-phospho-L-lactate transferase CofD family protein n=1 Tax=Spirillospora sp. NPDC048911 TaxID=3364527 RepID=UPI00371D97F6
MSARRPGRFDVAMFNGGRGGAHIARRLLRTPGAGLTLLINGYDNGLSTGALRRYLPGMLGPSDFRKNLALHLDAADPGQAALLAVLEHRLPPGTTAGDLSRLVDALADSGRVPPERAGLAAFAGTEASTEVKASIGLEASAGLEAFAALPRRARAAIAADLAAFRHRLDQDPGGLDLGDCALGNLVFAGAHLRSGGDFNAAVRACARTFRTPARLLNVTSGENAYLAALKENGRLLADEADLVAPQDCSAVTDLFLLREPMTARDRAELEGRPAERIRRTLAGRAAAVSPNPEALAAIREADLIVYGPGTPHSSLCPSYLTPGVADAIETGRAAAKVFVVNLREDHDVQGLSAAGLVDLTLAYLGDPLNERGTITHVLCHRDGTSRPGVPAPPGLADGGTFAGARWIIADLEDPERPGTHCGHRVTAILARLAGHPAVPCEVALAAAG